MTKNRTHSYRHQSLSRCCSPDASTSIMNSSTSSYLTTLLCSSTQIEKIRRLSQDDEQKRKPSPPSPNPFVLPQLTTQRRSSLSPSSHFSPQSSWPCHPPAAVQPASPQSASRRWTLTASRSKQKVPTLPHRQSSSSRPTITARASAENLQASPSSRTEYQPGRHAPCSRSTRRTVRAYRRSRRVRGDVFRLVTLRVRGVRC